MAKFLVALIATPPKSTEQDGITLAKSPKLLARRRSLHVLFLVNDLLHHTKYHNESQSSFTVWAEALQPYLIELFRAAVAAKSSEPPKNRSRLSQLLIEWERQNYYPAAYIAKLQDATENIQSEGRKAATDEASGKGNTGQDITTKLKKEPPFVMPAMHGEESAVYYDLPAGNMMPHILPNSATPINPQLVKPLKFMAGPADEGLIATVKDFMREVESLYSKGFEDDEGASMDIDELGQHIVYDEVTGKIADSDAYYGWSKAFCERMRRRLGGNPVSDRRGRSDSYDSQDSRKRRRYTSSESRSSRVRGRPEPMQLRREPGGRGIKRAYSRSSSSSHHRSRSPNFHHRSRHSKSHSRSASYSPPPRSVPYPGHQPQPASQIHVPAIHSPSSLPFPNPFPQGIPLDTNGLPTPPPPPPNYAGPWPPPPPPIISGAVPFSQFPSFLPPPPLPMTASSGVNQAEPKFSSQAAGSWSGPPQQQFQRENNGYGVGGHAGPPQTHYNGKLYRGRGRGAKGG